MDINYYKKYEPIDGKWYITKELGSGAFGTVFEITRKDFPDMKAALKVISIPTSQKEIDSYREENYDLDEKSVTSYFESIVDDVTKEFRLMAQLKGNTNIVGYEDHDVKPKDGEFGWDIFIRMELLTPMNRYFAENSPTQKDVIQLGIDICKALEICQKYQIIHRDIKPSNIFVSKTGDFKLGDFGVARTLEKTSSGLSKKGTYTYMAPEVFKGEKYNSNVDIYSLGILMYKLLNNNMEPFRTDRTYGDSEKAFEKRMLGASIPEPANAKGRLAEIVLKACSFSPKERYESPLQMRAELENILYNDNEKEIIYPEGDVVGYEASTNGETEEKTVSLFGDFAEKEDKTASVFAIKNQIEKDSKMVDVFSDEVPNDDVKDDSEKIVSLFTEQEDFALQEEEKKEVAEDASANKGKSKRILIKCIAVALVVLMTIGLFSNKNFYNIVEISAGGGHTVGLKKDGNVVVVGNFDLGQRKIEGWKDIVAISAGYSHTVGLKTDGTVVVIGTNIAGECNVEGWKDIVAISAGGYHTVGLKSDGTVVATGANGHGRCNVEGWEDLVAVSAGEKHTVGLKSDGTVVATGGNDEGKCDVEDWKNIIAVSAGGGHTVGLKSDGTVVATGANYMDGRCDVGEWKDIVAVSAGETHTVGLKSDGTVVAIGDNDYGQCNVEEWKDIVAVSAGETHTVGLKSDGTVVATGKKYSGQCNVGGWKLKID